MDLATRAEGAARREAHLGLVDEAAHRGSGIGHALDAEEQIEGALWHLEVEARKLLQHQHGQVATVSRHQHLAFDEIVGAVKVTKGVASTDNLRISGPAARIVMNGQVDLAKETQELRVKVNPQLSDTVSVAGALIGGPIAGVAAFIAQKLLKDPLNQITSYEYDVTGSWTDPVVNKVEQLPVLSAPQ